MTAIKSKTELPVHYAQDLGNKSKHIYIPAEKIREDILDREWSYQDTPLKSKHDLNVFLLNHSKDEIEREVKGFKMNFSLFIARKMEAVYSGDIVVSEEIKKTIANIRMNISFTPFCESAAAYVINNFRAPSSKGFPNSRSYYRKYLMELLSKRRSTLTAATPHIAALIAQNTSRTVDSTAFVEYIFTLLATFTKSEITSLVN